MQLLCTMCLGRGGWAAVFMEHVLEGMCVRGCGGAGDEPAVVQHVAALAPACPPALMVTSQRAALQGTSD